MNYTSFLSKFSNNKFVMFCLSVMVLVLTTWALSQLGCACTALCDGDMITIHFACDSYRVIVPDFDCVQ
jgi:hypothetical protein